MDSEWFAHMLSQPDVRSHSAAAIFLASQGADGYCHVEATLERCKQLDLSNSEFDKCEEVLLLSGTRAIAQIIRAVGFDDTLQLHRDVFAWIDGLVRCQTAKIRGTGIWGLGDLGVPPDCVPERLVELTTGDRLPDDFANISCRGMAFRMLARIDRDLASRYVDTQACNEYLAAAKGWRAELISKNPDNKDRLAEFDAESAWLQRGV